MSDYWYEEDHEYELEPEIELPSEAAELKIKLSINAGQIELAVQKQIDEVFEDKLKRMIKQKIDESMSVLLRKDSWGTDSFRELLLRAIEKRLVARYPEIVEDKINEFHKYITELKYTETRKGALSDLRKKAENRVDAYINDELKDSVAKSKEYIEQFSKNYFANNLFKAMGMMDKMLPQTENTKDLK